MAMWNTYVWVESADETAAKVRDAGGSVVMEPFDVMDAGRMAVFADPEGAAFCVWQAKRAQGRAGRQRARLAELQRPRTPATPRRRRRSTARCSAGRRSTSAAGPRCGRCPATATTSSATTPGLRERMAEVGAPDGLRGRRRGAQPDPGRPARRPGALERHLRRRRRRRDRRAGDASSAARCSSPPFDAPWVRMTVHRRPAGRDVHRQQVRAGEQGPRRPDGLGGRRLVGRLGGGAGALRPRRAYAR